MGTVRDPAKLKEMWVSWHKVGQPMKGDYVRMVDIANAGARELGFADTGAMWRAGYDMPAEEFAGLNDRLRSEEDTAELQLIMRISYAVLCLKKNKYNNKKYENK